MTDLFTRTEHGWKVAPAVQHSDTSRAAAESISAEAMNRQESAVVDALRHCGPLTDAQIFAWVRRFRMFSSTTPDSSFRLARIGLVSAGVVVDGGRRGKSESGRAVTMWELKEQTQ